MKKNKISKIHNKNNSKVKSNNVLSVPLTYTQVYKECPVTIFNFNTTDEIKVSYDIIAQDRAVRAIHVGLGINKPGYNIYVAGYQGTGKTSVIKTFLQKFSKKSKVPDDFVYVYDFETPNSAKALRLPPGEGKVLKRKMDHFIKELKREIPLILQSEDYENTVNAYLSSANERKAKLFSDLEKLAKSMDFSLKSTRVGIETIPMVNGKVLTEKEYAKLSDKEKEQIEARRSKLEPEVLDFARKIRNIEKESREYVEDFRTKIVLRVVNYLIEPLVDEYKAKACNNVLEYLDQVKKNIIENLEDFLEEESPHREEVLPYLVPDSKDKFKKYCINVFVDNSNLKGAPVIIESNPTFYNLFGKIEKNVEHGVYQTDFTMIKAGAIHKANGGYLVLNALDIFKSNNIWDTLKRILKHQQAFIEDLGEQYSLLPTSGLKPEHIPLNLKVILIGNDEIYHILYDEDEDFRKIFKIKADFDYKMDRNLKNIKSYASFVATRSHVEGLLPFDRSAIAAIVEFSSRLVEDQRYLSTQFGEIKDLTIESDFIAREQGAKAIRREHVEKALDQQFYRVSLFHEHVLEMIKNKDILVDVDSEAIGQVNALTVYDLGDYRFGKIVRITSRVAISDDGIINIERASRLSGRTHDKGVFILGGYLNSVLAKDRSLGFSASVCFEQSYGFIDGDSASAAELIAIISAMSEVPIKQNFAITGSVNQMGDIQPIGGINEKIEGFYRTCKLIGKGTSYNVIIPQSNVSNLMLHKDLREDVKSGYLNIYPVKYIWQAFELISGIPLGIKDVNSKKFQKGSALDIIKQKLDKLYEEEDKLNKISEDKKSLIKKAVVDKNVAKHRM